MTFGIETILRNYGDFIERNPATYTDDTVNLYSYVNDMPVASSDPYGLASCGITVFIGHNFNIRDMINKQVPKAGKDKFPMGQCVVGIGCGVPGENKQSIQTFMETNYPWPICFRRRTKKGA